MPIPGHVKHSMESTLRAVNSRLGGDSEAQLQLHTQYCSLKLHHLVACRNLGS